MNIGLGVPQDYVEAVKWYQLAADQGYAKAQYNLGLMHANGRGVPQDFVPAHHWLDLAAQAVQRWRRKTWMTPRTIATRLPRALPLNNLSEAQRRAQAWLAAHPRT